MKCFYCPIKRNLNQTHPNITEQYKSVTTCSYRVHIEVVLQCIYSRRQKYLRKKIIENDSLLENKKIIHLHTVFITIVQKCILWKLILLKVKKKDSEKLFFFKHFVIFMVCAKIMFLFDWINLK